MGALEDLIATRNGKLPKQHEVARYGHVSVLWPGKHGEYDFRVEVSGIPISLAELAFACGAVFRAEDRYLLRPNGEGRSKTLREAIMPAFKSETWDELLEVCQAVEESKKEV